MSITRRLLACAAGALGVAYLVYAAPPPAAMAVDLGLWEITTQGQMSGAPMIPADTLAQMSPEQRAKIQAMLARAGHGQKFKECMTEERRQKGFDEHREHADKCRTTVVTNTSNEYESHSECAGDEGRMSTVATHFKIAGRHAASGTVDITRTVDGNPSTIHSTIEAKWLASDCGSVKDIQREP